MIEEKDHSSIDEGGNDTGFVIVPVTLPPLPGTDDNDYQTSSSSEKAPRDLEGNLANSTLNIFSVGSDESDVDTADHILEQTGIKNERAVRRAVQCAAFWRSLGAETLIYMSSYGGMLITNGLIIRFTGFNALASTLMLGSASVALNPNTYLVISNLLKPPQDEVPEDRRKCHDLLNKYAFLPISWLLSAGLSGGALTALRDPSFGTQQIVSAVSAAFVGPIMHGLKVGARKCLKGSVNLSPEYPGVKAALETAYGTDPNPLDDNRPYRWGTLRDMFNRAVTITAGSLVLFHNSGFNVESYCIGGRDQLLNLTRSGNYTITGTDVEQYCVGGGMTYIFRELGISATYAVGMMVVEPVMRLALDKIFDYFHRTPEETVVDVPEIESGRDSGSTSDDE